MAWLSLAVVTLIFFIPQTHVAVRIASRDFIAAVKWGKISVAIPIPGTGALRLFLITFGVWLVIWLVLTIPDRVLFNRAQKEHRPYPDFLTRLGLWHDIVNCFQEFITGKLVIWLARVVFYGFLLKQLIGYLLQLAVDKLLPQIATWLAIRFSEGLVNVIKSFLLNSAKSITQYGVNLDQIVLFVFALLVLVVNLIYRTEKRRRLDVQAQQQHYATVRK